MTYEFYLKTEQFKARSILNQLNNLSLFNDWLREKNKLVEELKSKDILAYLETCKKRNNSQATLQVKLQNLDRYFTYLLQENKIVYNPVTRIKIKTPARKLLTSYLTEEHLELVYQGYRSSKATSRRNKIILGLIIYQGLSTRDFNYLRLEHVNLEKAKIELQGHSRNKQRSLELKSFQVMEMYEYIKSDRNDLLKGRESNYLIVSSKKTDDFINIRNHITVYLRKQFPQIKSLQQIRRSVIINWLKHDNLRVVQYKAGHSSVSSTEPYQINQLDELQDQIDLYHPLK